MDTKEIKLLSDEELAGQLRNLGADIGPIVASTRGVYERKLFNLTHGNTSGSPRTHETSSHRSQTYEDQEPEQEEQYDDEPEEPEPVKRSMYTSSFTDTTARSGPSSYYRNTDFDSGSNYRTSSYTRSTYEPLSSEPTRRFPSSTYQYQPNRQPGVSGQPAKKQGGWVTLMLQLAAIVLLMVLIYYFFLNVAPAQPPAVGQKTDQ